jgi:hypothetical protein
LLLLSHETTSLRYYTQRKKKGNNKQIEAETSKEKRPYVEDVDQQWLCGKNHSDLRENQAEVEKVLTVVDREAGAKETLKKLEVQFIPLVSVSEILKNKEIEK